MKRLLRHPALRRLLPAVLRGVGEAPAAPSAPPAESRPLEPGASLVLTVSTKSPPAASPPRPKDASPAEDTPELLRHTIIIGVGLAFAVLGTAWLIYWLTGAEERGPTSPEARDIAVLGLALLLGFLVALFGRIIVGIASDAVLLFLTVAPLFLMLIATDRINLLKAPGGLEVSFAERVVQIRNDPAKETVVLQVPGSAPISPGLAPESVTRLTMSIQFGRGDYQRRWLIDNLSPGKSQYVNLRYVVFVDANNRFIAFMPLASFINLLELDSQGQQLERVINQGRRQELLRFPGLIQTALVATGEGVEGLPTNGDVLRAMVDHNVPAVAVIDGDGTLIGLVERDQLVSDLLLDLTSDDGEE